VIVSWYYGGKKERQGNQTASKPRGKRKERMSKVLAIKGGGGQGCGMP